MMNPPSLYGGFPSAAVGAQPLNWDCGPLFPLLMSNVSFLDVNNDGYWSEADNLKATAAFYTSKFQKEGDLVRIFHDFMSDAKNGKFAAQKNQNLDASQETSGFTRIPMQWMRGEEPKIRLCNNVDPELCGSLEVRDILQPVFPSEPSPAHRVRRCRESWDWCVVKFGELYRNYKDTLYLTCDERSPTWDDAKMVTINRYATADKYSSRVNPNGVLTLTYVTFLLLVLVIWWLTVLEECRKVLAWWMAIIRIPCKPNSELICQWPGRTTQNTEEGKITVSSIDIPSKLFILFVINLPRTIIVVALSFIGTDFLIVADSYFDLILNSVALSFLTDIDDYIVAGVASARDQDALDQLQPVEGEHECCFGCVDLLNHQTSIFLLLGVIAVVSTTSLHAYIMPWGKVDLASAYECLCHIEGSDCIAAQLFGHKLEVPAYLLGVGEAGRGGKGR